MYQLMIVDDENIIVEGIRNSIPWSEYDVVVVATALNGIEAMQQCIAHRPDIIITDIKMPEMDGLEFIEQAKKVVPYCQIILLSAFEQFSYAQRAIELGVNSYLLKPIKPNAIIEKVCQCIRNLKETMQEAESYNFMERENHNTRRLMVGYIIGCWLTGMPVAQMRLNDAFADAEISRRKPWYGVALFSYDLPSFGKYPEQPEELLREIISAEIPPSTEHIFANHYNNALLLLYATELSPTEAQALLGSICEKIKPDIYRKFRMRLQCHTAPPTTTLEECPESYRRLVQQIPALASSKYTTQESSLLDISTIAQYRDCLLSNDYKRAMQILDSDVYQRLCQTGTSFEVVQFVYHQLLSTVLWIMLDRDIALEAMFLNTNPHHRISQHVTLESLHQWFLSIQSRIFTLLENRNQSIDQHIIQEACHYIALKASRVVSLGEVSAHVSLSPSYFSKLFKKEMGIPFIEYIKNERMERAKHLILHTNRRVYEISAELGYQSVQYFTRLFRESTGLTPLEFRQQNKV